MTKKIIVVFAIFIICLSCIFAGTSVFEIQFDPYSYQRHTFDVGTLESNYGLGLGLGYRNYVFRGISVGTQFDFRYYDYPQLPTGFYNFSFMAKAGGTIKYTKNFSMTIDLGLGMDIRTINNLTTILFDDNSEILIPVPLRQPDIRVCTSCLSAWRRGQKLVLSAFTR